MSPRTRRAAAAALVALVVVAVLGADRIGGRGGLPEFDALPDVLRALGATLLLFTACGWAPARVLTPASIRPHWPLLVLPAGAAVAAMALTLLGAFQVPLPASLTVVIVLGAVAAVVSHRRSDVPTAPRRELLAPAGVALLLTLLLLTPLLRNDSFATVLGENGDAHMATGAAELLQVAPPGAVRPELPIDHMPVVWASKYPIYYALAGASTLSGLDPVQTFATVLAVMAGLVALGFYLLALGAFRAGPAGALAAMGLVALDGILFRLAFDPFYNQLWALFSLPYVLLFGWLHLRTPSRSSAALLVLFLTVSVFAYPLLAPFPALFLLVGGWITWRERRAEGGRPGWLAALELPRGRRWLALWIPLGIVLVPVTLLLFLAALQKMGQAAEATLPGGDLAPWSGKSPGFLPLSTFLGLPDSLGVLVVVVLAAAVYGATRMPRQVAWPTAALVLALGLGAAWFRARGAGQLFHFKGLSFFGPMVVAVAGVGLAALVRDPRRGVRLAGGGALAVLLALALFNARDYLQNIFPHVTNEVWELRGWNERIPAGAAVRVDPTPIGIQQWAGYMLRDHPLSATAPLLDFFPHPVVGRKADYILVNAEARRPRDALGRPVMENARFKLYRQSPTVPGPDRSSIRLVDPPADGGAGD